MGELEQLPPRTVVVSALPLRRGQHEQLAAELGPSVRLVDLRDAGPSEADVDVVLAPPCSPQTIGRLRSTFPGARVVVVELQDDGSGLRVDGPVGRTLAGGASAYLLAPSAGAIGDFLLGAAGAPPASVVGEPQAITAPSVDDVVLARLEGVQARRSTST